MEIGSNHLKGNYQRGFLVLLLKGHDIVADSNLSRQIRFEFLLQLNNFFLVFNLLFFYVLFLHLYNQFQGLWTQEYDDDDDIKGQRQNGTFNLNTVAVLLIHLTQRNGSSVEAVEVEAVGEIRRRFEKAIEFPLDHLILFFEHRRTVGFVKRTFLLDTM